MARLDPEPTVDPSTVRRHVDKQVLRMYQSNWVDMTVDPNRRDLVFTVLHVPKHIELEFTPPMVDKTPMIAEESDEVDSDILNCTSSLSSLKELTSRCNEAKMDLLATMSEAEQLKQILGEHPGLRHSLENQYKELCDQCARLLGQLRAFEKTIRVITSEST